MLLKEILENLEQLRAWQIGDVYDMPLTPDEITETLTCAICMLEHLSDSVKGQSK